MSRKRPQTSTWTRAMATTVVNNFRPAPPATLSSVSCPAPPSLCSETTTADVQSSSGTHDVLLALLSFACKTPPTLLFCHSSPSHACSCPLLSLLLISFAPPVRFAQTACLR